MGTAVLTNTKLESTPHENILTFLDNRSFIPDPRNPSTTTRVRQLVYDSDPLMKSSNFGDFPYIVCEFPLLEQSKISCDGKTKELKWTHTLIARSIKDGAANSRSGVGRSDILSIADSLHTLFNTETYKQAMNNVQIFFPNLIKINSDTFDLKDKMVYEFTYTLTYKERFTVSS